MTIEHPMNDEQDLIDMGSVSEETKGGVAGDVWDGGLGRWAT